jgi:hypothetical protein
VEEELGQLRQFGHGDYAICARCGRPFAAQLSRDLSPEVIGATTQDFPAPDEPLCPDCASDIAAGEIELPLEAE